MNNPHKSIRSYIQKRKQRKAKAKKKKLFVSKLIERMEHTEQALKEIVKLSYGTNQNAWIKPYIHKHTRLMQFLFRKDKMEIVQYHIWLLVRNGIEEARLICESFHDKRVVILTRKIRRATKANARDMYREFKPHEMNTFLRLLNYKTKYGNRPTVYRRKRAHGFSEAIEEQNELLLQRDDSIYSYLEYIEMKRKILLHEFVEQKYGEKEFLLGCTLEELKIVDVYLAVLYGYILLIGTRYRRRREGKLN